MLMHEPLDEQALRQFSPVVLAYIGDAVFELMVRTYLVSDGKRRIKDIHHDAVEKVKAESQAKMVRSLYAELSHEEQEIVRWGRNAKSTPPRHADPGDYKMSTGFEALLGYLYLKGDEKRLGYIVQHALFSPSSSKPFSSHD